MNSRVLSLIQKLKDNSLDCLIVSSSYNTTYLYGFRKSDSYLVVFKKEVIFLTNFIYQYEAEKYFRSLNVKVIICKNILKELANHLKMRGVKNVGFESKKMSYLEYLTLKNMLKKHNIQLIETSDLIEDLRIIKSKEEVLKMKKGIEITKEAIEYIKEIIRDNLTEKDIYAELVRFMYVKKVDLSFDPIVATEENSYIPHHIPSPNSYVRGSRFILIDCGAKYQNYCVDLTRIIFLDRIPSHIRKVYGVVKEAYLLAIDNIKEGAKINSVDIKVREFLKKKKMDKFFGHGLGHGVGLEIHERPFMNSYNTDIFKEGMVVTVEPAVYLTDKFGIRIESMVLVKKSGCEVLDGIIS